MQNNYAIIHTQPHNHTTTLSKVMNPSDAKELCGCCEVRLEGWRQRAGILGISARNASPRPHPVHDCVLCPVSRSRPCKPAALNCVNPDVGLESYCHYCHLSLIFSLLIFCHTLLHLIFTSSSRPPRPQARAIPLSLCCPYRT